MREKKKSGKYVQMEKQEKAFSSLVWDVLSEVFLWSVSNRYLQSCHPVPMPQDPSVMQLVQK